VKEIPDVSVGKLLSYENRVSCEFGRSLCFVCLVFLSWWCFAIVGSRGNGDEFADVMLFVLEQDFEFFLGDPERRPCVYIPVFEVLGGLL
jgi:hypothetical protein